MLYVKVKFACVWLPCSTLWTPEVRMTLLSGPHLSVIWTKPARLSITIWTWHLPKSPWHFLLRVALHHNLVVHIFIKGKMTVSAHWGWTWFLFLLKLCKLNIYFPSFVYWSSNYLSETERLQDKILQWNTSRWLVNTGHMVLIPYCDIINNDWEFTIEHDGNILWKHRKSPLLI